jgi:uncharacterized protein (DUF697 family)
MSWLDTLEEIRKKDWSAATDAEREAPARDVVNICAYAGAATQVVPVPFVDLALLLPVHTVMVMTVGHIHNRKLSGAEAKRVVLELGTIAGLTFAGRAAINALLKFLPGFGALLSVPATFALTWALGRVSIEYFSNPKVSREDLKKLFTEAVQEGKAAFSKEAFDRFRQKNQGTKAPPVVDEREGREEREKREDSGSSEEKTPSPPSGQDSGRPKKRTL